MKITKLVHSCLLVEKDNTRILVDPGNYSWDSGLVGEDHMKDLSAVVVTHAHPDHLHQDFVEAINKSSPKAVWYGPQEVVDQLSEWGINSRTKSDDTTVKFIDSKHADLSPWFGQQPDHTSYVLLGELLIGGDCHTLDQSHGARIFGAAVSGGPWAGVVGFAKMIEAMTDRPATVIPLHDWHWNEEARAGIYDRLPEVLGQFDVKFAPLENGKTEEV